MVINLGCGISRFGYNENYIMAQCNLHSDIV